MNRGVASLLKLWITVALSAGALVATVEVDSTLSPFKVNVDRNPAGGAPAAAFSHSSYAGSAYYPSGLMMPNNDELVYVDEGQSKDEEDGEEQLLKRSMGMLRLGRASSAAEKRARTMAALRLGRSIPSASASSSSSASAAQSDDWRSASSDWKRTMGMLRLGRRSEEDEEADDGVDATEDEEDEDEEKRSMGMLRLGRSSRQHHQLQSSDDSAAAAAAAGGDGDKRSMGMLRLGRSAMRRRRMLVR